MAKSVQQELKALRERIKRLEGGDPQATVDEIVGSKESRTQPTRTAFADAVGAQDKKNYEGKMAKAHVDLTKNPRDYKGMDAHIKLAKKHGISEYDAGQLMR